MQNKYSWQDAAKLCHYCKHYGEEKGFGMGQVYRTINIKEIVSLKAREIGVQNETTNQLNLAMQSVQKRINYCEYHYAEIEKITDDKHLVMDRWGSLSYGGISVRTIYEANAFGFLQSLHALMDSLPYGLNIFYCVCKDIESPAVGWKPGFICKYKKHSFFKSLKSINEDETFIKLKSIVNRIKHKHIIRIKNTSKRLTFDDFSYRFREEPRVVTDQDVKKFLTECHDYLLPKYIDLWNEVKACKQSDLGVSTKPQL